VDVLLDAVGPREYASEISEVVGVPSHEQMVVLNTSRPVLREGEFDTGADRAAPASLFRLVNRHAGHKTRVLVVCNRGAALDIPENVIPGVPDLAGEQAQRVDLALVGYGGTKEQAGIRTLQAGPITLGFEAEDPRRGLPAVADLATGDAAAGVVATFERRRHNRHTGIVRDVPALVAPATTAVETDVETAPVVDGGDHRRRGLGGGAGREGPSPGGG